MQVIQFKEKALETIKALYNDPDKKYATARDTLKFVLDDVIEAVNKLPVEMPEKLCKYRIELWEHERGWGVDHWLDKDFDTEAEAIKYRDEANGRNTLPEAPDYYITAHGPKLVDVIKNPPKK